MPNYGNPNLNLQQPQIMGQQQIPTYGNGGMLVNANPYNNYMINKDIPPYQFLKCRPVSSRDQACACQIDLDGSLWVFTDLGNGKIYTKQVNNDGTATFKTYAYVEQETPYNSTNYVTKEEFNRVIQTLSAAIQPNNQAASAATDNKTASKASVLNF